MTKCKNCGEDIWDRTDDNYNTAHDQIHCPACDHWQAFDDEEDSTWIT